MQSFKLIIASLSLALAGISFGQSPSDSPRPIPLTRPEMKKLLEDVKVRTPRIPLPELTDKDREQLGDRAENYETRLRLHFLAGGDQTQGSRQTGRGMRPQDPKMTLDNGFKVELFWIVSRANNCQYCLGHQESKLLGAGRSEDRIASLDGDWSEFTPAERTAFAFARKFTYQPHLLSDSDIESLKSHYTDEQIIEMLLSMAWNNSINRWKEGLGVPQSPDEGGYSRMASFGTTNGAVPSNADSLPHGSYLTPTSEKYRSKITQVAPISSASGSPADGATVAAICQRPPLESFEEVIAKLQQAHERASRLPLIDANVTRKLMDLDTPNDQPVPNWMRLLAHFPEEGVRRAKTLVDADSNTDLNPLLKAQLSWIIARNDHAWYAVGESLQRLRAQGQNDDQIRLLDGDWTSFSEADQSLFRLAKSLAASPVVLTDREVSKALELTGPATVVQTVNYVTHRAAFDRITEAAGLPLESP